VPTTWSEQAGSLGANTFLHTDATGPGIRIMPWTTVEVTCRVLDTTIDSVSPDGYWYRIASSPWNGQYYAPANSFMNGDQPGVLPGVLPYTHNTDFAVQEC
jgi:hypothetical protein